MGFRRPIYAKGRLKAAWVLYRTVAWALPTDSVCGNDGERYEGFPVFAGKAHATNFRRARRGVSGGFDCFGPLPSPLPRGEGTDNGSPTIVLIPYNLLPLSWGVAFVEMMANRMGFPVFVGKAHATTFRRAERGVSGGFDCFGPLPSPLPRGEGIG